MHLADLAALDDDGFREVFRQSPVKRLGRDRFLRNVLIAIGNNGEAGLAEMVEGHLADPSPLVRAMAVWAVARLVPLDKFRALAENQQPEEGDSNVRKEWQAGLAPQAVSRKTVART